MRKKLSIICLSLLIAVSGVFAISQTSFVAKRVSPTTKSISKAVSIPKSEGERVPRHRTPKLLNKVERSGIASLPFNNDRMRGPLKVSPSGATLYGFLGYPSVAENLWTMDEVMSDGSTPEVLYDMTSYLGAGAVRNGKLIAFSQEFFWGMVSEFGFGEYDLATGERLSYEVLNIEDLSNAALAMAYDPTTDRAYLYTYSSDGEAFNFTSIDVTNPSKQTIIKENLEIEEVGISFTYSPKDGKFYAVNVQGIFAEVNVATGEMTEIIDTGVELAGYITGLCYSYKDDAFIWNANLADESSILYSINLETKSVTTLTEYSNYAQYNFIVTADEVGNIDSPEKPSIESVNFEKGSLSGSVTYKMPSKTYAGTDITSQLTYTAYVDGEKKAEGTASASESVKVDYTSLTQGNRVFSLIVKDSNGLESPTLLQTLYIGFDSPKAPTNVKFLDGKITWDAVTDEIGQNNGYVDINGISYEVYVDGTMITTTTDTSVEYSFDDSSISSHYAEVVAVSNGMKSLPGVSNKYISGDALPLPLLIEPTAEQIDLCTIIDRNDDGFTWSPRFVDSYYIFTYSYSTYNDADDWIILPPFTCDSNEFSYEISAESAVAVTGYPESYEIYYGSSAEPSEMTKIFSKEGIENSSWIKDEALFTINEPGIYYAAIRCTSPADQFDLRIRNINIKQTTTSVKSPSTVTDIEAVAADNGVLSATVSFNMPTLSLNGELLDSNVELEAIVKTLADRQTVKGKPGTRQSVEIETVQGNNQIAIQVTEGENTSPIAYVDIYTGMDIPGIPENFKGELSEDNMTIHLSWDAPSQGHNGGYINPNGEGMTYQIVRYDDFDGWFIDSSIAPFSQTSYDYVMPEEVGLVDLPIGVIASNAAGMGVNFAYESFVAGKPYDLPMYDDFTSGDFIYNPLTILTDEFSAVNWSAYNPASLGQEYANRSGIALIGEAYTENSYARLCLPKFSTEFVSNPHISLYLYCGSALIDIYAETYGVEPVKLISTTDINTVGWQDLRVELPDEFIGKKWVAIYVDSRFISTDVYCMFGGYDFKDYLANDIAITTINTPKEVSLGNTFEVSVTAENFGYESSIYPELKVEIFKDGELQETKYSNAQAGATFNPDEEISATFEFTTKPEYIGEIDIVATLINSDMNNSNNSMSKKVNILKGNALVVTDLDARLDDNGNVELFWTEPMISSGHESFEDYPVWSFGSTLGEFKCVDGDGYHQYTIDGLPIPDADAPKAFQVFDISSFGEMYADIFPASDGRQYIAAFCPYEPAGNIAAANDWLISPELKAGSSFSFEMDIFTEGYGAEVVEILTSAASDDISDFSILDTIRKGAKGWETFSYTLPEGAKYIALRYVSKDIFGIMIDNINYTNIYGEATISGYDVYRNGSLLAEEAPVHGLYTDSTITEANADYTYQIVPIVNGNRGLFSNSATINPSGIDGIYFSNMIYGDKGEIVINGFDGEIINIFTIDGKRITTVREENNVIRINIQPGIYIVNVATRNVKVFVR